MQLAKKACGFCHRSFRPDPRVGDRQYACPSPACQEQRKHANQQTWLAAHPDYFRGLYPKKKAWRDAHPHYRADFRRAHPDAARRHRKEEQARRRFRLDHAVDIQDEIARQLLLSQQLPAGAVRVDIQDEWRAYALVLIGLLVALRSRRRVGKQDQIALRSSECYKVGRRIHLAASRERRKQSG